MNLMDSIYKRHSIRKYNNKPIDKDILNEINALANSSPKLYKDIPMFVHLVEDGKKIHKISKGIIGSYGKIEAPHYLVITSEKREGYLENVGYTLQRLVLQLTSMKIGTCWIGGFIKKELLKDVINLPNNQIPVIVISFGYPKDEDDLTKVIPAGARRKEIKDFCFGDFNSEWIGIMNSVRRAPSAMNGQPWRFFKNGNIIDLYIVERTIIKHLETMNRIDAGIALAHLQIALEEKNINFQFINIANKLKKGLNYITSVEVK